VRLKRARRVRIHFHNQDPSLEGLLVSRGREYVVAVPQLLLAEGAEPVSLDDGRYVAVPRSNVWFYEVL
jgi:hypothetical protein